MQEACAAQDVVKFDEEMEDSLLWKIFSKTKHGWHHGHNVLAHTDRSSILDLELQACTLQLVPWSAFEAMWSEYCILAMDCWAVANRGVVGLLQQRSLQSVHGTLMLKSKLSHLSNRRGVRVLHWLHL